MTQIELSLQQAQEIARRFYDDIGAYVENHRAEFEAFLMKEGLFEQEGVNN